MKVSNRSRLVTGNQKCYALAMLEERPAGFVRLTFMGRKSDLNGMVEMLHGDHGPSVFLILRREGLSPVVISMSGTATTSVWTGLARR